MKQVKLVFVKGGRMKILAHGVGGAGTEKFTEELAKLVGTMIERHAGVWHHLGLETIQLQQETKIIRDVDS